MATLLPTPGVLGPLVWQHSPVWLGVLTNVICAFFLPVAYLGFFLMQRRRDYLKDAMPQGWRGRLWLGAMAAVMGMDSSALESLCRRVSEGDEGASEPAVVSCANFNAPGQVVIAGDAAAVARVSELAAADKGKAIPLKVSAPFHCALMAPAARALESVLASVEVGAMRFPVVANVDARPNADPSRVKDLLVRQVDGAVRWEQAVRLMHLEGITHALEIGPGKVLAGLGKRIAKELKVLSVNDAATIASAKEFLTASGEAAA